MTARSAHDHATCGWPYAWVNAALEAPCGCKWTPGIDLPTTECDRHRDDPELAHR